MENNKKKASDFLKEQEMDAGRIDMESCCKAFRDDMEDGLAGKNSTLKMIPTYIETEKEVPKNKPVIVMDAGGTNFRVAVVHFDENNQAVIEDLQLYKMPGIKREVRKERFFKIIAGYIRGVINKSPNIGFCFSYPTKIFPNKDGRLIHFSKEIKAKEVHGQMIGKNLNAALNSIGYKGSKNIVILNDTVTTLLAGRAASAGKMYDSFIGFILGTGTNTAYIEENKNILKKPELDPKKNQIINIESGGFGKAPQSKIDPEFRKSKGEKKQQEQQLFEKMISGAYLGPLSLATIKKAVEEEGLFSPAACKKFKSLKDLTTPEINDFLQNPLSAIITASNDDSAILTGLIEGIVERAAKLTAINLSAAVLKSGKGKNPKRPVCIVAEGTTFDKLQNLKSHVESYLTKYLTEQKGRYYEIISVENATLIGAAIAGLTN